MERSIRLLTGRSAREPATNSRRWPRRRDRLRSRVGLSPRTAAPHHGEREAQEQEQPRRPTLRSGGSARGLAGAAARAAAVGPTAAVGPGRSAGARGAALGPSGSGAGGAGRARAAAASRSRAGGTGRPGAAARSRGAGRAGPVSYTHLRAHETGRNLVCRLLLEKKKT